MRYLRLALTSLASCAVALALGGCGSSVMNSMAGNTPSVSSVGAEANGVAPNRWLYVQFNEAMDPATINNQTVMVKDSSGRSVPGNVAYDSNFDVAGFQPNPPLQANTSYTLTVTTGAKSAQEVALQSDFKYNFTTRADTDKSPIGVKTVVPANGATCVSTSSLITITFTEGADVSTLTSANIAVTGPGNTMIPAAISYNVSTAQVTISPKTALPSGTISVTVKDVADAAGVAMATPYTWSFSTACTSGGGGGGGVATTQYMAPIIPDLGAQTATNGQITVDTSGMVNVQLMNASAGKSYDVQFCEAVSPFAPNQPTSCIEIGWVTTSASGSASTTVKFPQSGDWAGDFVFVDNSGNQAYQTYISYNMPNATYMSVLLPINTTNNGAAVYSPGQQEPLTSGTVTCANGNVTFTVKGTAPNTSFQTNESETNYIDSSGTYELSTFTTDAQGNGTSTTSLNNGSGGDIFQVGGQGNGFIGGFSVPQ